MCQKYACYSSMSQHTWPRVLYCMVNCYCAPHIMPEIWDQNPFVIINFRVCVCEWVCCSWSKTQGKVGTYLLAFMFILNHSIFFIFVFLCRVCPVLNLNLQSFSHIFFQSLFVASFVSCLYLSFYLFVWLLFDVYIFFSCPSFVFWRFIYHLPYLSVICSMFVFMIPPTDFFTMSEYLSAISVLLRLL